ncbi:MAG: hypothetical protein PF482_12285 [Desulfobacteraceae bacterium]|jgi:hypothetical protein|nr:hypothetical protein [Desulfobacteraceae bacterium]
MPFLKFFRRIHIPVLIILFTILSPQFSSALQPLNDKDLTGNSPAVVDKKTEQVPDTHLQPIDENHLDAMSPSLIAPPVMKSSAKDHKRKMDQEFENSICFKRCHNTGDFYPSDNTAKQWRLLIDQEGHAIFSDIPWESPQQKEQILDYLLNNARNTKPGSAGIGVW